MTAANIGHPFHICRHPWGISPVSFPGKILEWEGGLRGSGGGERASPMG
jgi:hypothetical protein